MRKYSFLSAEQTLSQLNTSNFVGLTDKQASERLAVYGANTLNNQKQSGILRLFFSQFKDVMIILLIAAAAISAVIASISGEASDLTDTFIIIFIIFLNAVVGSVQQYRADRAIQQLKKLAACTVKTLRGGKVQKIDSESITVGDIILLEEGDMVPADCRIISANGAFADESALTGESLPVEKKECTLADENIPLGATVNALFSSTYLVKGNARAVVTGVGMNTEIGAIANLLGESQKTQSPLERSLNILGKVISGFVLAVTAVIFFVGLFVRGGGLLPNFMTSVAVAVAAIPEGLPAVVTIIMAMGVQKMSRKNVVIRKLKSVETLGGCNVICTDKTGTLTCNKMKVAEVFSPECARQKLLQCMTACTDVKGKRGAYMGDSTEVALINYADGEGFSERGERLDEIPFSSERKMMTVRARFGGETLNFCKGAPDVLLEKCGYILTDGGTRRITESDMAEIRGRYEDMSRQALRVLGFAFCGGEMREQGLTFIGICGLSDRLKAGAKKAVAECKTAGIRTVMITGDHALTAFAIARELGIAERQEQVITGVQLDGMGRRERAAAIEGGRVFARVTPAHKNLIVKALQKQGNVVAMTGDGINDAPSIKSADIGIAMGGTGTDVTKNVSDMVITDDNFSTIVAAVKEGRRISANIKKTIQFFLSTNVAEVLAILIATLFFVRYNFLTSTQLLWLNLITDSFPVLALGMEREDFGVMNKPPVRAEKALFSASSVRGICAFGLYITAVCVGLYAASLSVWGNAAATTVTFLTLSFCELFHAFNVRSETDSAFKSLLSNKTLLLTVAVGVVINVLLCVTPLRLVFGLEKLTAVQWLAVALCSLSVIIFGDGYKLVTRLCAKLKASRRKGARTALARARRVPKGDA